MYDDIIVREDISDSHDTPFKMDNNSGNSGNNSTLKRHDHQPLNDRNQSKKRYKSDE